jgi:hypothetical protein
MVRHLAQQLHPLGDDLALAIDLGPWTTASAGGRAGEPKMAPSRLDRDQKLEDRSAL